MKSDVVVQDFAPRMLDHEEAIQEPEGQRRYGEEVKGDDRFSMIGEEHINCNTPRRAPGRDICFASQTIDLNTLTTF
jgi:hypothetical protein